ncbi:uL15 family ribosomal protein [Candidatus Woesearchaeota archaeon]|nr:uL15 family ribosomal protein [Candidatus Woesearchaeota archaeon]
MKLVKKRKSTRLRAGTTHGYGSMKKHRGAGHRGGRGRAGSGKRADAKKPRYWKVSGPSELKGKYGFKRKGARQHHCQINISMVEQKADGWIAAGTAKRVGSAVAIDLGALGYTKLLGAGVPTRAYAIAVEAASAKAIEKIAEAKGSVSCAAGEAAPTPGT